jgi:hypothetical protein
MEFGGKVAVTLFVEYHAVLKPGTSSGLNKKAQTSTGTVFFLCQHLFDLAGSALSEVDNLLGCCGGAHYTIIVRFQKSGVNPPSVPQNLA